MTVQILHKKFTVGQYHQMIESGILTKGDRVELIEGEIIEMSPVGRKHAACVDRLNELLVLKLATKAIIRVQNPILLSNNSQPQPDLAILRRRDDFYRNEHPQVQDIFALIEVSDTTIEYDRNIKIPLYAANGIAEVWIVNLNEQVIEVYSSPTQINYEQVDTFNQQQTLNFQAFPNIFFSGTQILV